MLPIAKVLVLLVPATAVVGSCGESQVEERSEWPPAEDTTVSSPSAEEDPPPTVEGRGSEDLSDEALDETLAELEGPPTPGEATAPPATVIDGVELPEHGCAALLEAPQAVWPRPGPSDITKVAEGYVVVGHAQGEDGGEDLFVVQTSFSGEARPLARRRLRSPMADRRAPPAVSTIGADTLFISWIDGGGRLYASELSGGTLRDPILVSDAVDTRFPPTVWAAATRRWVAWVKRSTPMHVMAAELVPTPDRGLDVRARHDVTPETMGATAPTFVAGQDDARLVFMDARAGVSPVIEVRFVGDAPRAAEVLRPTGTAASPPDLAVGFDQGDHLLIAYAAVGNLATTAIGLVRARGSAAPQALVPGTGYGTLTSDAAGFVFAAAAPTGTPAEAPREVHVRAVGPSELSPPLVLRGADGTANHPAVTKGPGSELAVAFSDSGSIYVQRIGCRP